MSPEEKIANKKEHSFHLQMKSEVRRLMEKDTEEASKDFSLCCCNFDLQKILTTPRSEISSMYYYSKLNVWNFTIFDVGLTEGHSFVWNETVGNRGSNEIASYLKIFIEEKVKTGVKKFIFYTDNCAGQNRNKNVFSFYIKIANELNVEITHR